MSKGTKGWLIAAVSLIVAGSILFVGVMTVLSGDFNALSTKKLVTKECLVSESFRSISIDTDTADVELVVSDNAAVTCREWENETHTVSVVDGVLSIKLVDTRKWYQHIGVNLDSPSVTVYLPVGEYANLTVKASTGDVTVPADFSFENVDVGLSTGNITYEASATYVDLRTTTGVVTVNNVVADTVNVTVSTGKTALSGVRCQVLTTDGSTGRVALSDVIARRRMGIKRTTGNVTFDRCDGGVINVETSTGSVTGTLLTDKKFKVTTTTGNVQMPDSDKENGASTITTTTGNVDIKVAE